MASKKDWEKTLTIEWSDELNDDFDEVGLQRPDIPENYKYRRSAFSSFFFGLIYHGLAKPILGTYCLFKGIKFVGKNKLKVLKGSGAYFYANHVAISDVFKLQAKAFFFGRRINILGYPDSLSIPVAKRVVKGLGLIPVPKKGDLKHMLELTETVDYYVNKKRQYVLIFPEAHIWPYYTHIRNFLPGSFIYPAKSNAPVVPIVTTWKKRKIGKKPRQIVYFGDPIFPKEELNVQENKAYLHSECLKAMKEIAESVQQQEYVKYVHVEKKKQGNN